MATIVPSELHPDEEVTHQLAQDSFKLGGGSDSYETDDRAVIGNAIAHPWLEVEYDDTEVVGHYRPDSIEPSKDVLGAEASIAFDPKEIEAALAEDDEVEEGRVAIESGLDQDKSVEKGGVAFTLAADDTDDGDKS